MLKEQEARLKAFERFFTRRWVIHVWRPGQKAKDLVNFYPLQLSSLVSGDYWRLKSRRSAKEELKKTLIHLSENKILLAGPRGVLIDLGEAKELDFEMLVDESIRNREAEKRLPLTISAYQIVYPYELLMIVSSVLIGYDSRIRGLDVGKASIEDIRELKDAVELGFDELDLDFLITIDPYRTVLHKGAKNQKLFRIEKVLRRRVRYLDSLVSRKVEDKERRRDWIIGILLSLLSVYQVMEVIPPPVEKTYLLAPVLIILGTLIFLMRKEISSIGKEISSLLRKIKGSLLKKEIERPPHYTQTWEY